MPTSVSVVQNAGQGGMKDASSTEVDNAHSKPPLLCLGAPRTGTASLGEALRILGYPSVHHGLYISNGPQYDYQWQILNRAADATFPNLSTYTGKPFSRDEWDELLKDYDAITDLGAFFASSLIDAYPDAKIILVEREVEAWLKSIRVVIKAYDSPSHEKKIRKYGPYSGSIIGLACLKIMMGWTRSEKSTDMWNNMRSAYERHNRAVREKAAPEQLLDFKLADGWGPLCEFLGKPVPDVPFPRINDAKAYDKFQKRVARDAYKQILKNMILRRKADHK